MSVLVSALAAESYQELNIFQPGQSIPTAQQALALSKINQLFDLWNAMRDKVWCDLFTEFTFTPNLNPHTIGPSGATWTMTVRPVTLDAAAVNINTQTPNAYVPISIIDRQRYELISAPGTASGIPYAVYYEEDWTLGKLFFYPVPSTAYKCRLTTHTLMSSAVTWSTSLTFPPGYQIALTLTLSEWLATALGRQVAPGTAKLAREARHAIGVNNVTIPTLITKAAGMDQSGAHSVPYNLGEFISRNF